MSDDIHEVEEFLEPVEPGRPFPWRMALLLVLALGLLIFTLQNSDPVNLNFLWFEFTLSEAVVILLTAVVSAVITYSTVRISQRRKRKRAAAAQPPTT